MKYIFIFKQQLGKEITKANNPSIWAITNGMCMIRPDLAVFNLAVFNHFRGFEREQE